MILREIIITVAANYRDFCANASKLRVHRYAADALYIVYPYVTEHHFTNMVVFLLTTAVTIFMHGLVSEQIALLRIEQHSVRGAAKIEDQDE